MLTNITLIPSVAPLVRYMSSQSAGIPSRFVINSSVCFLISGIPRESV